MKKNGTIIKLSFRYGIGVREINILNAVIIDVVNDLKSLTWSLNVKYIIWMNAKKNTRKIKLKLVILFKQFLNTFEKKSIFLLNRNNFINLIVLNKQVKDNKIIKRLFEIINPWKLI